MSDSLISDITITTDWVDITATIYPAAANQQSWIQNKGPGQILVAYSSSPTAPTGGGYLMNKGDTFGGNAAHIWVLGLFVPGLAAAGLV